MIHTAESIHALESNPDNRPFWQKYRGTLLLLALLALLAYGAAALTPSLLGDEWGFLGSYIYYHGPACPDWQTARPFGACWLSLVFRVAGPNMHLHHASAILMNLISAVLLLVILDQLLPKRVAFNSSVAAMFLLFPTDVTRTWLAGNVVFGTAVYLAAACLFVAFWRNGRWWTWLAGMIVLLIALGTYEVVLGVTIVLSITAFAFAGHRTWRQRLGLLAPALAAISFSGWRWLWQQAAGEAFGHDVTNATFSATVLLERLIFGVRYSLQQAWTDSATSLFSTLSTSERFPVYLVGLLLVGIVLYPFLIFIFLLRETPGQEYAVTHNAQDNSERKDLLKAFFIGLLILGAGYFPIIIAIFPGTEYTASRTHHTPSIGAALVICATLFGLATFVGRNARQVKVLALTSLVPLLALGLSTQLLVQHEVRQAWADQKKIWQGLFEQAPDLIDGSHVLIMLNGYGTPSKGPRPFISGDWGASNALRLLYGKNGLNGHFAAAWPPRVLSAHGENLVLSNFGVREFPALETLVFIFDKSDRELIRLSELEQDGQVLRLGPERVLSVPTDATDYRWLVEDK